MGQSGSAKPSYRFTVKESAGFMLRSAARPSAPQKTEPCCCAEPETAATRARRPLSRRRRSLSRPSSHMATGCVTRCFEMCMPLTVPYLGSSLSKLRLSVATSLCVPFSTKTAVMLCVLRSSPSSSGAPWLPWLFCCPSPLAVVAAASGAPMGDMSVPVDLMGGVGRGGMSRPPVWTVTSSRILQVCFR